MLDNCMFWDACHCTIKTTVCRVKDAVFEYLLQKVHVVFKSRRVMMTNDSYTSAPLFTFLDSSSVICYLCYTLNIILTRPWRVCEFKWDIVTMLNVVTHIVMVVIDCNGCNYTTHDHILGSYLSFKYFFIAKMKNFEIIEYGAWHEKGCSASPLWVLNKTISCMIMSMAEIVDDSWLSFSWATLLGGNQNWKLETGKFN